MEEVFVPVKVYTDEEDGDRARQNARSVVAQKLAMSSKTKGFEDGKIYDVVGITDVEIEVDKE